MAVTPKDFIRQWQKTPSPTLVAEALDMSPQAVAIRAKNYRDMGIRLRPTEPIKPRSAGRNKLDVDALNAIIEGGE